MPIGFCSLFCILLFGSFLIRITVAVTMYVGGGVFVHCTFSVDALSQCLHVSTFCTCVRLLLSSVFFLNSFFLAVTQLNCSTIIVITIIQQNRGKVHIYMGLQCQRKLSTVCYRVSITSAQIYSREVYLSVFPISRLYFECQSKRIVVNFGKI